MNNADVYNNIEDFKKRMKKEFVNINVENGIEIIKALRSKDNILVLEFPNKIGISGITQIKKDRNKDYICIYVNTNDPIGRRNFSFLHEIYHVFYEKSNRGYSLKRYFKTDEIEKRAEIFASNILIPRDKLLIELKRHGCKKGKAITMDKIFKLQIKFKASFQAIACSIESLNKDSRYNERYQKYIPNIEVNIRRYYQKWDDLEEKTLFDNKNNNLNSIKPEYIFPEKFKEDIYKNFKCGRISKNDILSIYDFFGEELK